MLESTPAPILDKTSTAAPVSVSVSGRVSDAISFLPGRIAVAMSGGVDSSVVAAMAQEMIRQRGGEVFGVTLRLYDDQAADGSPQVRRKACCAGRDIDDARAVCDQLDLPHYVWDYESRFRQAVLDDFADSYLRGETPLPCVRCNQRVKFTDLLTGARKAGAVRLMTGHYVRKVETPRGPILRMAKDPNKDQSFFLFTLTHEQLQFLEFPLGDMEKPQTRALAAQYQLPTKDKPDSQDICFVPNGRYADVIEKLRPQAYNPGKIYLEDGTCVGRHDGVFSFTIGQRKGLKLGGLTKPLFVLAIDADAARVTVGPMEALGVRSMTLKEVNWLGFDPLPTQGTFQPESGQLRVKVRNQMQAVLATLSIGDGRVTVEFLEKQAGVSPGQPCVFYDVDRLLGGGWIVSTDRG